MTRHALVIPPGVKFVTLADAARAQNWPWGRRRLSEAVRDGEIKSVKLGKYRLLRTADLDAIFESGFEGRP